MANAFGTLYKAIAMTKKAFEKLCKEHKVKCLPLWIDEHTKSEHHFIIYGLFSQTAITFIAEKVEGQIRMFINNGYNKVTLSHSGVQPDSLDPKSFLFKGIMVSVDAE